MNARFSLSGRATIIFEILEEIFQMTILASSLVQPSRITVFDARRGKVPKKGTLGRDSFIGSSGHDIFDGDEGHDSLYGNDGDDSLRGGNGNDALYGGNHKDSLYGDAGNDLLMGGEGNDLLYGDLGNDTLFGENGDDKLYGEDGNDVILGGNGNDEIYGGNGNDFISGMEGNDKIYGNSGADTLNGGDGNDAIYLGHFNSDSDLETCKNFINGGSGNDVIYAGFTDFNADGGDGFDIVSFIFAAKSSDSPAGVMTDLSEGTFSWNGYTFTSYLKNVEGLIGTTQNDQILGDGTANLLSSGLGDDELNGRGGTDTLIGGGGNDTYIFEKKNFSKNSIIRYDSGHDLVVLAGFDPKQSQASINQVQNSNNFTIDVTDQDNQKWRFLVENGWKAYRNKDFGILFSDATLKSFTATSDTRGYFCLRNSLAQQSYWGGDYNDFMTNGSVLNFNEITSNVVINGNRGDDIYEIRRVYGNSVVKITDDWTSGTDNNLLRLSKRSFGDNVQAIKSKAEQKADGSFLIQGKYIDLYVQNSRAWNSLSSVNIQLF